MFLCQILRCSIQSCSNGSVQIHQFECDKFNTENKIALVNIILSQIMAVKSPSFGFYCEGSAEECI